MKNLDWPVRRAPGLSNARVGGAVCPEVVFISWHHRSLMPRAGV